jgi:hypothetical protein
MAATDTTSWVELDNSTFFLACVNVAEKESLGEPERVSPTIVCDLAPAKRIP